MSLTDSNRLNSIFPAPKSIAQIDHLR